STAWTIVNAKHKTSGLSATVINQMLAAPQLPLLVRAKILEYIEAKITGSYGHSPDQIRRFIGRLAKTGLQHRRTRAVQDSIANTDAAYPGLLLKPLPCTVIGSIGHRNFCQLVSTRPY